jgi:hypothetical protein
VATHGEAPVRLNVLLKQAGNNAGAWNCGFNLAKLAAKFPNLIAVWRLGRPGEEIQQSALEMIQRIAQAGSNIEDFSPLRS